MTQPGSSTEQFQLVYYGTPENEGAVNASNLASVLLGMSSLVDVANRTINGDSTSASLSVRSIRSGSVEIQFAIDILQVAVNLTITAEDLKNVLFGGGGAGGVLGMYKLLLGRQPRQVTEQDGRTVRIEVGESEPFLGHQLAVGLYREPEIRRNVQRVVSPLVELHLDRLVIRDNKEELVEITRDEAHQMGTAESQQREVDMVEAVREELQTGFARVNERIDNDIGSWVFLGRDDRGHEGPS